MAGSGSLASYQHNFVPDDEGLFCLFCGRTAGVWTTCLQHRPKQRSTTTHVCCVRCALSGEHKAPPGSNPNDDGGFGGPKGGFDEEVRHALARRISALRAGRAFVPRACAGRTVR